MPDNVGWEAVADWFIEHSARSGIGVRCIERWTEDLPPGATVLDVGCGAGSPRSAALMPNGARVYALDASPTLVRAYQSRFPDARVACEPVETSRFFDARFDAILAWGLVFLLPEQEQRRLLDRLVAALTPRGRLLFTAPDRQCAWNDATTGQPSLSLGAESYRQLLHQLGAPVVSTFEDEGQNHYYSARRAQDS
jgi:2-polyprenyl-3-methyl-5-hydroxy-6-metoxy-1,4-benzoquinol methylase